MTSDLDLSALSIFPNISGTFWEIFWMVTLLGITVGLVAAIVTDFRAPRGSKSPTIKGQRYLGVLTLVGIVAAFGAGMLGTVVATNEYQAEVCSTLEAAYETELRDCDALDIPTEQPDGLEISVYGATDAMVPDETGKMVPFSVTLVWDGQSLLLAATEMFDNMETPED
jgi:hypothetical protein